MKKIFACMIFFLVLLQAGPSCADKAQAIFAIQKTSSLIETVKAKGEELKSPTQDLRAAREYIAQAEAVLKKNTSLLGSLKKEAEPEVQYYADMAEISASIVLSRLEKISQERENVRLEKLIPETEAKIKIFKDKDAEILRLKKELEKPRSEAASAGKEMTRVKKERTDLSEQVAKFKLERENLNGKIEALNGVVASLQLQNQRLKGEMQEIETKKGSDVVALRSSIQSLTRKDELVKAAAKFNYLVKVSDKGLTFIIPRKELIKTTNKGAVLAPGIEKHTARFSELIKTFPENKLKIDVYGFGTPAKFENDKATDAMAGLLKQAFIKSGISEASLQTSGSGSGNPIFSKSAVEENRRVEITVLQ